jgi:hypothetical protein
VTVAMMYGWRGKDLAQNLFLQLPVDRSNTPAAMMRHGRPTPVCCRKVVLALASSVIL